MINIAIDGHVGSGKSTLAKGLAKKLGFKVFDTGAVYRTIACEFISRNLGEPTQKNIKEFVKDLNLRVKYVGDVQYVYVNGKEYSGQLRLEETSMMAAKVAKFLPVRQKTRQLQQEIAKTNNVVMEGRDIATEVLPNADFKFFITASEQVRAQRRYAQLGGKKDSPSFDEILKDLRQRDYSDENRKISPLKPAADSIIIDSSNQTLEQTIEECLSIINKKIKKIAKK